MASLSTVQVRTSNSNQVQLNVPQAARRAVLRVAAPGKGYANNRTRRVIQDQQGRVLRLAEQRESHAVATPRGGAPAL